LRSFNGRFIELRELRCTKLTADDGEGTTCQISAKVHGLTFVTRNVADIAATGVSLLDPFSEA
jgi:hypothetical protein